MAESSVAKTGLLLVNIDLLITEIKLTQENILPQQRAILTEKIRITKRSANSLLLTAHVSLRDKIAYEQQRRAFTRQKTILSAIEDQERKWNVILDKAKEEKKQLKRLQKVQQEYEITLRLPDCAEEYKAGLEKRLSVALERTLRAQQKSEEAMQQLKQNTSHMEKDKDWHRKQDDLDEKVMARARQAAARASQASPRCEKVKDERTNNSEAKMTDWLPPQYMAKEKKENQRPIPKAKGRAQG